MHIVADKNLPFVKRLFNEAGTVSLVEGRTLTPADVKDADALVVRSVTKVNEALLSGSKVRFVGTATIGTDHLDLDWLEKQEIKVVSAPGSNALSVAEYVISALDVLVEERGWKLRKKTLGIVGHGAIGTAVQQCAGNFFKKVKVYDPLLDQEEYSGVKFSALEEVMACDVVTLHIPYTTEGEHPTSSLINSDLLTRMPKNGCLINTSRGKILPDTVLKPFALARKDVALILDVWEDEPEVPKWMKKRVDILTPHIAGYAYDSKVAGVDAIHKAFCKNFGIPKRVRLSQIIPSPLLSSISLNEVSAEEADGVLSRIIRLIYDVRKDDLMFRDALEDKKLKQTALDYCRSNYPERRNFAQLKVLHKRCSADFVRKAQALGFRLRKD